MVDNEAGGDADALATVNGVVVVKGRDVDVDRGRKGVVEAKRRKERSQDRDKRSDGEPIQIQARRQKIFSSS